MSWWPVPDPGRSPDRLGGTDRRRAARPHRRPDQPGGAHRGRRVALGFRLADPIIGLVTTVATLAVLRQAAREVFARLMDAVDPALVDRVEAVIRPTPGVLDVGQVRLRWIGHALRAECDVVVDEHLSLVQAHRSPTRPSTGSPRRLSL